MLANRINEIRKRKNITLEMLASMSSVPLSTLKKISAGITTNPNLETVKAIAGALGCSLEELSSVEERDDLPPYMPSNIEPATVVHIPIVGRVAAGSGCYAQEDVEGYETVPAEIVRSGHKYVLLRVQGDSMSPKILEGDLVLIQCQPSVDSGSLAVVTIDDEDGVVKRVKYDTDYIELISENPYYPPRIFTGPEVQRVRVVGLVKRIIRNI